MTPAISKKFIIIKRTAGLLSWLSAKQTECWVHAWGSAPPGSLPRWSPFAAGSIPAWVNRVPGRPRLGGALALGLARVGGLGSLRRSLRTGAGTWARRGGAVPVRWVPGGTAPRAEDSAERPRPRPQRSGSRGAPARPLPGVQRRRFPGPGRGADGVGPDGQREPSPA